MARTRRRRPVEPTPEQRCRRREAPGAILRGPPIAVTCDCGAKQDVRYGDTWVCEQCGKRWNTAQIPAEQYEAIRRLQLRYRIVPVALSLFAALAIFFTLTNNVFSVFFLLPAG